MLSRSLSLSYSSPLHFGQSLRGKCMDSKKVNIKTLLETPKLAHLKSHLVPRSDMTLAPIRSRAVSIVLKCLFVIVASIFIQIGNNYVRRISISQNVSISNLLCQSASLLAMSIVQLIISSSKRSERQNDNSQRASERKEFHQNLP